MQGVLFNQVYVTGGDGATGIDIGAEVGVAHGLKGLRLAQICIATGHSSTGVNIANEQADDRGSRATVACDVSHSIQGDGGVLGVRKSGKIHRALVRSGAKDD